ncbi:MAG: ERAP1-like C-terminal domain-containing protein, partial [Actinomycetota bacterium]
LQRALAESFISAAEGEDQLKACEEILSGTRTYEGLSVDIDLRWRIVETLASAGRAGDQLIDEEVRRDPTDAGERYAVTCRGARPSPAAKEEIWDMFTVRPDVPVATLRSAVGGFHRIDQHELLRPYAGRYFEAVRNIWDTREHEVARVFATGMFPKMVIGDDVVATAQEYLATQDPPYPLRRILLEAQDSMKRAVRARSKDREAALS